MMQILKKYVDGAKRSSLVSGIRRSPAYILYEKNRIRRQVLSVNRSHPQYLLIETVNICNASCIMCGYKTMARPKGTMDSALFFDIIDQYAALGGGAIGLVGMGEPLMDQDVFTKIKYASKKGFEDIIIFTNGSLLTSENIASLLESGLKKIFVSIDGLTKEGYESIRIGLDWEKVTGSLLCLLRENRKSKRPVAVNLRAMLNDDRLDKDQRRLIGEMRALGAEVETSNLRKAHDWACQARPHGSGEDGGSRKEDLKLPCYRLWSGMQILWNGDMALCCVDYDGKIILGNVREGIAKIWSSQRLNRMREAHLNTTHDEPYLCKLCDAREPWPR